MTLSIGTAIATLEAHGYGVAINHASVSTSRRGVNAGRGYRVYAPGSETPDVMTLAAVRRLAWRVDSAASETELARRMEGFGRRGAQRVAERDGVASVHVETDGDGCRQYVAYAKPGYWFPAVECQTVIADTVRELETYARAERLSAFELEARGLVPETVAPVASAAHAAAVAHADVVPFAWVSDVVRTETAYRASLESAQRAGNVSDADAARRLAESIGRVCDAVCDAADGWDAEPVVAIEPGNACHAATLQQSGVSFVRATTGSAYIASHNGRELQAFGDVADAVAHAAGPVAPVVLPGENADAVAAVLAIRADAAAGHRVSLAELVRAQSAAIRADGDAAHARGIARAAGMRAAIDAELARD